MRLCQWIVVCQQYHIQENAPKDDNMKPRISIVTPAFNRADLMPSTLHSVLGQDFSDFEYIVVDDGSTDGTLEWLQTIEDKRLTVLTHPNNENRGQAASINLGLRRAQGDFIVILDSDDLLAEGSLRAHADILEENESLGMVYGQGVAIDGQGNKLFPLFPDDHYEESDPNRLLLDCYIVSPGLCMFRKETVKMVGELEENFRAAQDHDFVLRIAEVSKIAYSSYECFFYRKHEGTISAHGQLTRWKNGFEILRRASERYPYSPITLRKRRAVLHFRLGQTYLRNSSSLEAIRHFVFAGCTDPVRALGVILGREKA